VVSCSGSGSFDYRIGRHSARRSPAEPRARRRGGEQLRLSATTATTTANITAATLTPAITASNKTYDGTSSATIACTLTGVVGRRRGQLQRHGELRICRGRHRQDGYEQHPGARWRAGRQLRPVGDDDDDDGQHHGRDADAGDHGEQQDLRRHVERDDQLHADRSWSAATS
jgi:hypothetical protein